MAASVKYAGSNPTLWYDASKYDPNNLLASVNQINGLYMTPGTEGGLTQNFGDRSVEQAYNAPTAPYIITSNGTKKFLSGDATSGYTFTDNYNDPSGKSEKDQMGVTYKYDPRTGTAIPTATQGYYQPSDWVSQYRPILQNLAPVLLAGVGGAYAAGAGEAGGAAGATELSGMDLAADAAVGTGNNISYAGGALGGGGAGAAGGAGEVSGMDLAADAGAGTGNNISYAGSQLGGAGGATSSVANTGSDAHFYNNPTAAEGGLGNMGGAGTATIPTVNLGSDPTFLDALKQGGSKLADWVAKNPQQAAGLAGAIGGLGGSGSGGNGDTSGGGALSHAVAAQDMGKAAKYGYTGFTPGTFTPRAGHSQLSNAVNVNDPSAAMFGVGRTPTYYKVPGMADGGSVDDVNLWSGDERAYPSAELPAAYADTPASQGGYHDPQYGDNSDVRPWYAPATDWLNKLGSGDKGAQKQMVLGMGALGLIASLLNKNRAPGFRSVADMQAGLGHNAPMSAANQARMDNYFNTPAAHYVPPPAPQVLVARADGGRIEPKVGTRGPVRTGGTGGGLSPEALRLLAQAEGGSPQPSGVGALPANPVTDPAAITAARMRSAGLAHGGQPGGSPVVEFNPMAHGSRVPGDGPGQTDSVAAALAPGEYVFDADTVSALGDGNNAAGANVLDRFREQLRAHKRSAPVSDIPPQAKSPLAYLAAAKQKGVK